MNILPSLPGIYSRESKHNLLPTLLISQHSFSFFFFEHKYNIYTGNCRLSIVRYIWNVSCSTKKGISDWRRSKAVSLFLYSFFRYDYGIVPKQNNSKIIKYLLLRIRYLLYNKFTTFTKCDIIPNSRVFFSILFPFVFFALKLKKKSRDSKFMK